MDVVESVQYGDSSLSHRQLFIELWISVSYLCNFFTFLRFLGRLDVFNDPHRFVLIAVYLFVCVLFA